MSDIAIGDEKKEKAFKEMSKAGAQAALKDGPPAYDEQVKIRRYNPQTKTLAAETAPVKALRWMRDGTRCFWIPSSVTGVAIEEGSQIIDADGNTYIVAKKVGPLDPATVVLKPPAKP